VELEHSPAGRRHKERAVRELPTGTPVVLSAPGPGAARRCRGFAARTDVVLEREFLALPSVTNPAYVDEDARESVEVFLATVLATPPGAPLSRAVDVILGVIRALSPLRLIRTFAPGRVVVGRCG